MTCSFEHRAEIVYGNLNDAKFPLEREICTSSFQLDVQFLFFFFLLFFVLSVTEFEKILLSCGCCWWCCCFRIDVVCYFFVLTFRILLAILHIEFKVFFVFVYYKIATSLISCCIVYFLMLLLLLFLCVCLGEFFRKCLWYPYPCWAQPTACPLARTPRAPRSWVSEACLSSRDRSEMGI